VVKRPQPPCKPTAQASQKLKDPLPLTQVLSWAPLLFILFFLVLPLHPLLSCVLREVRAEAAGPASYPIHTLEAEPVQDRLWARGSPSTATTGSGRGRKYDHRRLRDPLTPRISRNK
jgi:hypothetical protein